MKKGIIVLLIAVLVSGFAFAGFSGYAGLQLNADLDNGGFGFANKDSMSFTFEFAADTKEITGEDLHVEVAASVKAIVDKIENAEDLWWGGIYDTYSEGFSVYAPGLVFSLDTAKIVGKNWYVSILGAVSSAYDYAKAAVETVYSGKNKNAFDLQKRNADDFEKWTEKAASYAVSYKAAPGVTVGYNGYTASFGFEKKNTDAEVAFSATIETPEFAFSDDAVKVQAAAEVSKKADAKTNAGASAKATIGIQDTKVVVATDLGLQNIGGDSAKFAMDARVDFTYKFVAVNVYTFVGKDSSLSYGGEDEFPAVDGKNLSIIEYKDFYLEAKAAFDLNEFEVPLKVSVSAKNLTNTDSYWLIPEISGKDGITINVDADYEKDAIAAGASFMFNTESKDITLGAKGKYAAEKFTAGAGVSVGLGEDGLSSFNLGLFAETDKVVNGARFGLAYGLKADKTMKDGGWAAIGDGAYSNDFKAEKAGTITAYTIIKF